MRGQPWSRTARRGGQTTRQIAGPRSMPALARTPSTLTRHPASDRLRGRRARAPLPPDGIQRGRWRPRRRSRRQPRSQDQTEKLTYPDHHQAGLRLARDFGRVALRPRALARPSPPSANGRLAGPRPPPRLATGHADAPREALDRRHSDAVALRNTRGTVARSDISAVDPEDVPHPTGELLKLMRPQRPLLP